MTPAFLFATGIENSTPTIHNGATRVDEMEKCGHYTQWQRDFALVSEMGIKFLRYGPPLLCYNYRPEACFYLKSVAAGNGQRQTALLLPTCYR